MIPKPEQTRWASQEAAIKAEINQARNTFDLVRMANAIVRLDALHAQIEAAGNSGLLSPVHRTSAWQVQGDIRQSIHGTTPGPV